MIILEEDDINEPGFIFCLFHSLFGCGFFISLILLIVFVIDPMTIAITGNCLIPANSTLGFETELRCVTSNSTTSNNEINETRTLDSLYSPNQCTPQWEPDQIPVIFHINQATNSVEYITCDLEDNEYRELQPSYIILPSVLLLLLIISITVDIINCCHTKKVCCFHKKSCCKSSSQSVVEKISRSEKNVIYSTELEDSDMLPD